MRCLGDAPRGRNLELAKRHASFDEGKDPGSERGTSKVCIINVSLPHQRSELRTAN